MKKLVFLTGAGMSAESGIGTFRDAGGLWEGHRIEDVASPEGFKRNPDLVLDFYNQRRRQLLTVEPNPAHLCITRLQEFYDVHVITQNVDDLHERASNLNITHLHGELVYACSSKDRSIRHHLGYSDIHITDKASDGSALRPDIVWFGEPVPKMEEAILHTLECDILVVVGTSLEVYPAAGLIHYTKPGVPIYIIDPNRHSQMSQSHIHVINETATLGMKKLYRILVPNK